MDHPHDEPSPHPPLEVGVGDVTAHPRHTGHRWFDLAMALTAILISSVSLVVAIQHGRTDRELVQAASWPFIQESTNVANDSVTVTLDNSGIGPAKMQWLEVLYRGRLVHNPSDLLQQCCGVPAGAELRPLVGRLDLGNPNQQVIRPGASITVMQLAGDEPSHVARTMTQTWSGISFRGCYCSVFDECWLGDLQTLTPRKVKICEANPDHFEIKPSIP